MKNRTLKTRKDGEKMDGMKRRRDEFAGAKIASMYSFNCDNAQIYGFSLQLKDFAESKNADTRKIKDYLKKLDSYKFYEIIAKINEIKNSFDYNVVSCYWKGTPNLRGELWHNYTTLMPILKIPIDSIFVKLVDDCIIHPAKILESSKQSFLVKYFPVIKIKEKIILGAETEKIIGNPLSCKATPGDYITIHFSSAVEKINDDELKTLLFVTKKSLEKFNEQRR